MISSDYFSILGGGFGIYGYATAIAELDFCKKIITLEKYRSLVEERIIESYWDKFEFVANPEDILVDFSVLSISLPPFVQEKYLEQNYIYNGEHLFLEKPLATSSKKSLKLCQKLLDNNINFSIGYLFLFTKWFQILKGHIDGNDAPSVTIKWTFKAHHYLNNSKNWKQSHSQGGGALRYYAIHVIAVLSLLKFYNVLEDNFALEIVDHDNMPKLSLSFMNDKNQIIHLLIDSDCEETIFEITSCEDDIIFSAQSPFHEQAEKNTRDFRIKYLKKYISQTYNKTSNIKPEDHLEICKLWMKIESFIKY